MLKMLYLKFLFSFLLYVIFIHAGFIQDKLFDGIVMHLQRLDTQCRGKNVPCKSYLQGVQTVSTKILIENVTLIVKEGVYNKLTLTVYIDRCRSKENLDSCELYLKQGNIDYCKGIDPSNPLIEQSPVYSPFVPPLKCPVQKGIYYGYNSSYDLAPFIFFKLEGWYWKIKSEVTSEHNKLVFCMFIEGYVTHSKSK